MFSHLNTFRSHIEIFSLSLPTCNTSTSTTISIQVFNYCWWNNNHFQHFHTYVCSHYALNAYTKCTSVAWYKTWMHFRRGLSVLAVRKIFFFSKQTFFNYERFSKVCIVHVSDRHIYVELESLSEFRATYLRKMNFQLISYIFNPKFWISHSENGQVSYFPSNALILYPSTCISYVSLGVPCMYLCVSVFKIMVVLTLWNCVTNDERCFSSICAKNCRKSFVLKLGSLRCKKVVQNFTNMNKSMKWVAENKNDFT